MIVNKHSKTVQILAEEAMVVTLLDPGTEKFHAHDRF
jgi:hypothetical protein